MKKLQLLFMFLVGLFSFQLHNAQSFTVGTCSTGIGTNDYGPMRSNTTANSKNRIAFIIPANQLLAIADGTITSTYFRRFATSGSLPAGTNFKLYLKNTALTEFGAADMDWSVEIGTATLVYDGDPATAVGSTAGYKQFVGSTNFVYTAGSNLAIYAEYAQTTAPTTAVTWDYEYGTPCIPGTTSTVSTTKYWVGTTAFPNLLTLENGRRPVVAFDATMPPPTTVPACTTITAPVNAATGVSVTPTISWNGVYGTNGASSYLVNVGTTPGGTDVLNNYNAGNVTSYAIPSTSPLAYNSTYYVTVIPTNSIGPATGCGSSEISFTTINTPCPSVSSPLANATGTSLQPTITWSAVNGATGYILAVGSSAGASDIVPYADLGNALEYTFATPLNPSTQYFYTVYAYQGANQSTGCTERNFTTGTATPPANDNCSGAVALTVNAGQTCTAVTSGNTLGATMSMAASPCAGNPDDDVWYSFVATNTAHLLTFSNVVSTGATSTTDIYVQVLEGTCAGTLTSVACSDSNTETLVGGLTIGSTYLVRVYTYGAPGRNVSFDLCVSTPPAAPLNDECALATVLTPSVNSFCTTPVSGTTAWATNSNIAVSPCTGTADDDVWYSFVATATEHTVMVSNVVSVGSTSSTSLYLQAFSGSCGALTSVICDTSYTTPTPLTGLTIGSTYYVRLYNTNTGFAYANTFDICILTPVVPANDDCANATLLTANATDVCAAATNGTTLGATNSSIAVAPCTGTADDDVWYSFVATSTSHIVTLSNVVSVGTTSSTSLYLQAFSGPCGTLASMLCDTSSASPAILNTLTPGNTYYVRVYNSNGAGYANNFSICVTTPPPPPANDECSSAASLSVSSTNIGTPIAGNTASATPSAQTAPTCDTDGINDDVWYSFTATSTNHLVNVIYDHASNELVTAVYSGDCTTMTQVACFAGDYGNASVYVQGLTVGQTYYVRIYTASNATDISEDFQISVTTPTTPTNDTCDTALALACNGTAQGSNAMATDDTLPTSSCGSTGTTASYKGVWFTVTAVNDGAITVSACGTDYDSYLRVYTGDCTTGLTCFSNTSNVGYSDTNCGTSNVHDGASVTFTGVSGTTYYILLTGYTAARVGNYNIAVTQNCTTMGVSDVTSEESKVKVYPNPFTEILNIADVREVASISITDMAGRVVKNIAKPTAQLQLGDLKSGMYLVTLKYKDGSVKSVKAIKK